jgi:LMBR1 domain-containing protein 1
MSYQVAAAQGYIQTSLIWVTYAVAVALLFIIASIFVYIYQKPRDRAISVTIVCVLTLLTLLATVLLLPVDVALVSSTVRSSEGRRKDWATQDRIDGTIHTLKIVYYTLYSVDAFLCLIVIPFTYFFYEEYDEVEAEEGRQGIGSRLLGALKYTIFFVIIALVLFLAGFFVPINNRDESKHKNLDYLLNLLLNEARGERALTFGIGALITIGTFLYAIYTGAGLALLPVTMIKSAPAMSAPDLAANTSSELEANRERQAQLEARNDGRNGGLDPRDRRELESL